MSKFQLQGKEVELIASLFPRAHLTIDFYEISWSAGGHMWTLTPTNQALILEVSMYARPFRLKGADLKVLLNDAVEMVRGNLIILMSELDP